MRRHATTPSAIRANATPRSSSSRSCSRRHDPAERPGGREPPLPDHLLRVEERERVPDPDREHRRVDREEERRHGDPRERSPPVGCAPREHDERRQQGDSGRAGQEREPRRRPCLPESAPLGEQERRHREEQEERLAVHGAEEERRRRDREKEDRVPRGLLAEAKAGQPVEQHEGGRPGRERDEHAGEQVVAEQEPAEPGDEERVEREERRRARGPGVAVLRDPEEPVAVPPPPDVDRRAELVEPGAVPLAAAGVERPVEPEHHHEREQPDRCAAPEEQPERGRRAARVVRHGRDSNGRLNRKGERRRGCRRRIGPGTMATIAA